MITTPRSVPVVALAAVALTALGVLADGPTTAPSSGLRNSTEIQRDIMQVKQKLAAVLNNPQSFSDAARRPAAAATALPLLKRMDDLFDEIAVARPAAAQQVKAVHVETAEYKAALGDPEAIGQLAAVAADPDAAKALRGRVSQMKVQWLQAGSDAGVEGKIADAAEVLAKAHADSIPLTNALAGWSQSAATPELTDRLLTTAAGMTNPAVSQVQQLKAMADANKKLKRMENKPFALTGTTVDGKPFSTADYKGKVVLVDFWATWCGPCKAELPNVQAAYAKYHGQGLEIVGVSNDYSADKLNAFIQQQNMPWPELYNDDAGGNHEWNPITTGYGIMGIPHMFVIDRNGVLVSADARASYETLIPSLVHQHG